MPFAHPADTYATNAQHFYGPSNDSRYDLDGHDKYYYAKQRPYDHSVTTYHHVRQENQYGSIGAPVLPPIRIPDNIDLGRTQAAHARVQEAPKEEKVGGVAAHLDYEMEQMIEFVAEMAQGMYALCTTHFCLADIDISRSVQPNTSVSPQFRKYISGILTSTRLPSSTIVLALHYLSTRMTMLSNKNVFASSSLHLHNMLTTALMLASKFLDDNTFQNRSWAEVSRVPVAELNKYETEWLVDIKWDLHIDSEDPQGFNGWLKQWKGWQAKKVAMSMEALKLTPVDPTLRFQHSAPKYMPPTPLYTPPYSEAMYGMKDRTPPYWNQWPARNLSPPSANHTSPNTPNWYEPQSATYNQRGSMWSSSQLPRLPPPSTHSSPTYYSTHGQQYATGWGHGAGCGCGCGYCAMHPDRYSMQQSYAMQTVVG